ncbi:MAG: extracellular solute-binding protein [Candidatus Gastranaerophilales bacterium]|nr:extracellular solute-binding protein [Candidatus Gastranaerophilales bacterium]
MFFWEKNDKNKRRMTKLLAGVMSAAMVMGLASCGKQGNGQADDPTGGRGWVYTAEYITLENADNLSTYDATIKGDSIYYSDTEWPQGEGEAEQYICEYSLSSQDVVSKVKIGSGNDSYVRAVQIADDGTIYAASDRSNFDSTGNWISESLLLAAYDGQGNQLWEQDVTEKTGGESYIDNMVLDDQNRIYLILNDSILLFSSEGAFAGEVKIEGDSWIRCAGVGKDGKVYVSYESYDIESKNLLAEVDFDGKKTGAIYENFPSGNGSELVCGTEYDFLVDDGSHVYGYNMADQQKEDLFSWVGCDINPSYLDKMAVVEDGRILALMRDWSTNEVSAAYLSKTDVSELPDKVEMVIGTFSESQELQTAVVNFNRQSDTCHLTIKNYLSYDVWTETTYSDAIATMNSEIASSNNCPDIIVLSRVNMESLAAKDVFEDLTPYLQKSSVLSQDDFLASALSGYTVNGCLVGIPKTFTMRTMVGRASDLGTQMGWTLGEMIDYAKAHPDSALINYADKSSILSTCLMFAQDSFIDYTTGTCNFDSDTFKELLEFVASYPDEFDWQSDDTETLFLLQSGDVLMEELSIYDLNSVQLYPAMFDADVNYIGYPTSDGSVGCAMESNNAMAIASKAKDKEAAWSFLEFYLTQEEEIFSWGLPTRKSSLDALIEEETTVQYFTDENGDPYLDEDGNPIEIGVGGGMSYGGWEFSYHRVTEEEIELVKALMNEAKPVVSVDDTIINIITEEAAPYFAGQKSVDDVANVIQSRVKVYVDENQ